MGHGEQLEPLSRPPQNTQDDSVGKCKWVGDRGLWDALLYAGAQVMVDERVAVAALWAT